MNRIDIFIENVRPVLAANNQLENIELYLRRELKKFYDAAFCDGQENVLMGKTNGK